MSDSPAPQAEADQTEARWLDATELTHWKSLIALVMTLPPALDAQLRRDAGLNSFEYHVLAYLSEAPGRAMALSDLAELAEGSISRISHAVDRLERAGVVQRRSCTRGRSRAEAVLTAAGWELLQQAAVGHVHEARRLVVDRLSADQLAALGEAAGIIVAATRGDCAPGTAS